MKRALEITSQIGTEEDPLNVSIDSTGISIETEPAGDYGGGWQKGQRVTLTPAQFDAVVAEMERFRRAVQVLAEEPPAMNLQAAE